MVGPEIHAHYIFDRLVRHAKLTGKDPNFETLFSQLESFYFMNNLSLNKKPDGPNWIIECFHEIGPAFSEFSYNILKRTCEWTGKYEIYNKEILNHNLIIFLRKKQKPCS